MNWHEFYNRRFIANPGNDATKYGVTIAPATVSRGQVYYRIIGIRHLSGLENHMQHNVFCDVLDEQGKRLNGATLVVVNANGKINHIRIDKPDNEAGANAPMHREDELELYVAADGRPSDHAKGFHIRHRDEESGTTWGHHSFYVVWQRVTAGHLPPVEEPPIEEEPPEPVEGPDPTPTPGPAYTISSRIAYLVNADDALYAEATSLEAARRIVAALIVLDASDADHSIESYRDALKKWAEGEA